MSSGRYRVVFNGFSVVSETWDDPFQFDGKRDEVFIAAKVIAMDARGNLIAQSEPVSRIMGDTNMQVGRIAAGTASDMGGLRTGDSIPTATPWIQAVTPTLDRNFPPVKLWEGDLHAGEDVVLLTPGIWEDDASGPILNDWLTWTASMVPKLSPLARQLAGADPTAQVVIAAVELGLGVAASAVESGVTGAAGDRPIGMVADGTGNYVFNPSVIVLNHATAEYLIRTEPAGKGPGVLAIRYRDDVRLQGDYIAYLQVERVGAARAQPHHAVFVSQVVPGRVKAGESFEARVTMRNTGSDVWIPDGDHPYRLGSQNPQDNTTWGILRGALDGPVSPGAETTFRLRLKAPHAPGNYPCQWRMVHERVTWFGEATPNVSIAVEADPFVGTNGVSVLSVQVPTRVTVGESFAAVFTLRNTGTRTWAPGGPHPHRLGSQNPQDNVIWGQSRIQLPHPVAPGQQVTIAAELRAPFQIGLHGFQWRMVQEGAEWFGAATPARQVRVTRPIIIRPPLEPGI
jgi:hypothetical protein